jgi:hypothetical protein
MVTSPAKAESTVPIHIATSGSRQKPEKTWFDWV